MGKKKSSFTIKANKHKINIDTTPNTITEGIGTEIVTEGLKKADGILGNTIKVKNRPKGFKAGLGMGIAKTAINNPDKTIELADKAINVGINAADKIVTNINDKYEARRKQREREKFREKYGLLIFCTSIGLLSLCFLLFSLGNDYILNIYQEKIGEIESDEKILCFLIFCIYVVSLIYIVIRAFVNLIKPKQENNTKSFSGKTKFILFIIYTIVIVIAYTICAFNGTQIIDWW